MMIKRIFESEALAYLFFGVLATGLSFTVYEVSFAFVPSAMLANTVSTVLAVVFMFITNKLWVFRTPIEENKKTAGEFIKFMAGRLLTYLIETGILVVTVDILKYNKSLWKLITTVIVIVLNYIISKKFVFEDRA